jgi:3-methyl-2-oxobutanoate hydroxymethyltransferase
MSGEFKPKFVRRYANLEKNILQAVRDYKEDVQKGSFPSREESY